MAQAAAQGAEEQAALDWYATLPGCSYDLSLEAQVSRGDGAGKGRAVQLVPDVRLHLVLAASQAELDRYAPHIKACRRRLLQALPAPLGGLELFSVRAPVRCALLS